MRPFLIAVAVCLSGCRPVRWYTPQPSTLFVEQRPVVRDGTAVLVPLRVGAR